MYIFINITDSCLSYFQKMPNLVTLYKYCALLALKHKEAILGVKPGYEANFHFLPACFSVMIVEYPPRNLRLNLYNTNRVYHRLHLRLNNDINIRYFLSFNQQPTAHRWLAHIFVCEDIFIFFLCENVNVHSISTGLRF